MSEGPPASVPKIWPSADRPAFRKTFALELDDHLDVQHASRQLLPPGPTIGAAGTVALFVALITNFDKWQAGDVGTFIVYVLATVVACALLAFLLLKPFRRLLRSMYRRRLVKAGTIGKPVESTVDESGISYTVLGQTVTCTWQSLYALEEDAGTFHFWMSRLVSHPWPARLFASEEERQVFRESVLKWSGRPFSRPVLARLGARGRFNLPAE
ncbi:hypothetical protein [Rhizobium chutanense]|uniref:hypothetical protein n=1 Tax=Rhizobium chutanense TaxID=2035448 RepID=UPI001FDFC691|nr:hypothetical protein [Rhizobium chutanense]